jgi:HK97 family phage major capsid protein
MTHQEVCDKIGTLQAEAEVIVTRNAAVAEWPSEDTVHFDKIHADMKKFREQKRRLDLQLEVKAELDQVTRQTEPNEIRRQEITGTTTTQQKRATDEECDGALRAWLLAKHGPEAAQKIRPEWRSSAAKLGIELNSHEFPFKMAPFQPRSARTEDLERWEKRALTVTTTAGGYLISAEMNRSLEEARLFYGPMLQLATTIRTETGANLPFPTFNGTATKGRILGINTQVTQTDPVFGQMVLGAFKYSSDMVLVPEELIEDSGVPLSDFLGRALGERIGRILNEHFTTGAGTTLPFGVVVQATAVNLGAGTASGTGLGADAAAAVVNLLKILHGVDIAYRNGGEKVGWMMNDATLQRIAGLVDTTGRPIWMPSLVAGAPDRLLGYRIFINNDMTSTVANLARTILFGDFSKYYIREVRSVSILSSRERFIDFHQTAFLGFGRYDGNLLNAGTGPVKAGVHQT